MMKVSDDQRVVGELADAGPVEARDIAADHLPQHGDEDDDEEDAGDRQLGRRPEAQNPGSVEAGAGSAASKAEAMSGGGSCPGSLLVKMKPRFRYAWTASEPTQRSAGLPTPISVVEQGSWAPLLMPP